MKAFRMIPFIALMALIGCSSSKNVAKDDVYYSPYGNTGAHMATNNGSYVNPQVTGNSEYDYQA